MGWGKGLWLLRLEGTSPQRDWPAAPQCPSHSAPNTWHFLAQESHRNFPEPRRALHPWWASPELYLTDPTVGGTCKTSLWNSRENSCQELWWIFTSSSRQPHELGHSGLI